MKLLGLKYPISRKQRILTVLDIGSSKVVCVIARLTPLDESHYLHGRTHHMEVLGFGEQVSHGIKSGIITDMAAADQSIRIAVGLAEKKANLVVDSLIVNYSSANLKSYLVEGCTKIGGGEVLERDVRKSLADASRKVAMLDRHIVHSIPFTFTLDGERGIADPVGMTGDDLSVDVHFVTTENLHVRNVEACVNRAHLSVEAVVATPYASGLAVLVEDEARLGAACIDMGGGTTSFSVFTDGRFVHAGVIPIGGDSITRDIARGFSMSVDDAERLKALHGSTLPLSDDDRQMISVKTIAGDMREMQYPRSLLNLIIRSRVEEILEMVRDRLNNSGYGHVVGRRVVLTGGGCQLTGLPETARRILGRNVRIGRPLGVSGLRSFAKGSAFSAVVGLLIYPQSGAYDYKTPQNMRRSNFEAGGRFQRVGQWFRESF